MVHTLIQKLQKKHYQLSGLEKQVFDYILRHPEEIQEVTAEELAKELFLSTATISRTAKRLGFKGFQELKYAIKQYNDVEKGSYQQTTKDQDAKKFCDSICQQLQQMFAGLANAPIKEVVDAMFQAETIEIFGVGGSLPTCIDVARKLTFLGKKANARIDWDELQAASNNLTSQDLAIIVSNSGETLHVIDYANNLKNKEVRIVSIVGTMHSTLEKMATFHLSVVDQQIYADHVDLSTRASLNILLDFILIKLSEKLD